MYRRADLAGVGESWGELELGGEHVVPSAGVAGGSARREHERRKAKRERLVREKHPRIGGLLIALREKPAHELNWAIGAAGEERVGRALAEHCSDDVLVLHDRRWPTGRANLDHLAIAPTGVWVIDAKAHKGRVAVERPLFAKPRLVIKDRDQTGLIEGLHRQVRDLGAVLAQIDPNVEVHGALCFTDADLPLMRTLTIAGYPLLRPKPLAKRLNQPGPLMRERAELLASQLAERLPVA